MKETLEVINDLRSAGVIGDYAIGGAVGATFYLEPISTLDLDVFVAFNDSKSIITLSPIYEYLAHRGYQPSNECVLIGQWPVQFLPIINPLVHEAVSNATDWVVEGVSTKVMTAEHLAAIALQTGRPKDLTRILLFLKSKKLDTQRLNEILLRHQLIANWKKFSERFPDV